MTIQGLWQILDESVHLSSVKTTEKWQDFGRLLVKKSSLSNAQDGVICRLPRRVAVDLSLWIYHAEHKHIKTANRESMAGRIMFYRICRLLENGIFPIFVCDGKRPWFKRSSDGGTGGNMNFDCPQWVLGMLKAFNLPVLQAKGEAEAECVQLVKCGYADCVLTDDCDALAFGAPSVIRNRSKRGKNEEKWSEADVYEIDKVEWLSEELIRWAGVLCQSDYGSGVHRIGIRTALDLGMYMDIARRFNRIIQLHKGEIQDAFKNCTDVSSIRQRLQGVRAQLNSIIQALNCRPKHSEEEMRFSSKFIKIQIPIHEDTEADDYFPNWCAVTGYYLPDIWTEDELRVKAHNAKWDWMHEQKFQSTCISHYAFPQLEPLMRYLSWTFNWSESTIQKRWTSSVLPIVFAMHLSKMILRKRLGLICENNGESLRLEIVNKRTIQGVQEFRVEWKNSGENEPTIRAWLKQWELEIFDPELIRQYQVAKPKSFAKPKKGTNLPMSDGKHQMKLEQFFRVEKRAKIDNEVIDLTKDELE